MENTPSIYEKMLKIMEDVQYLSKDDHVKFNSTNYKAMSEEKVTDIMHQQMVKNRLIVYPIQQQHSRTGQLSHVDVTYRMVNVDNPQEYIDIVSCGDGADSQDKGAGKAMTYAFKYMWLRAFSLPTGEDPDKISSAELDAQQAAAKAKAEKAQVRCKKCGRPIGPVTKDGVTHSAQWVADARHGLCKACAAAEKESTNAPDQV